MSETSYDFSPSNIDQTRLIRPHFGGKVTDTMLDVRGMMFFDHTETERTDGAVRRHVKDLWRKVTGLKSTSNPCGVAAFQERGVKKGR